MILLSNSLRDSPNHKAILYGKTNVINRSEAKLYLDSIFSKNIALNS